MTRLDFKLPALLTGAALLIGACPAAAAEVTTPSPESRYAVHGQRLDRPTGHESVDGRFRVDLRLEPGPAEMKSGGEFDVRARLFDAKALPCGAGPDTIFANGFEPA